MWSNIIISLSTYFAGTNSWWKGNRKNIQAMDRFGKGSFHRRWQFRNSISIGSWCESQSMPLRSSVFNRKYILHHHPVFRLPSLFLFKLILNIISAEHFRRGFSHIDLGGCSCTDTCIAFCGIFRRKMKNRSTKHIFKARTMMSLIPGMLCVFGSIILWPMLLLCV